MTPEQAQKITVCFNKVEQSFKELSKAINETIIILRRAYQCDYHYENGGRCSDLGEELVAGIFCCKYHSMVRKNSLGIK